MAKLKRIKFDHQFTKLRRQKTAKLMGVERVFLSDLDHELISEDTHYKELEYKDSTEEGDKVHVEKNYEIKGEVQVLLTFHGIEKKIPFTTLRRYKKKAFLTYMKNIGEVYNLIVKDSE